MQQTVRCSILVFLVGFLALFVLRLGYGYWQSPNGEVIRQDNFGQSISSGWNFASGLKNYASSKIKRAASGLASTTAGGGADQKYEKIANVGLRSSKFDDHEAVIRNLIKTSSSLIQFEQRRGLKGHRVLQLAVGVNPNRFDTFVEEAQTFGKLTELTINKSDKTNEYRELQAKRVSLEKTREALTQLKQREGEIRAMIELEKQILSLEQQIQNLGVSLGDFDAENEFVTVKMLLAEAKAAAIRSISFVNRALVAFTWTVKYYALLWLSLAAAIIAGLGATLLVRIFVNLLPKRDADSKG